MPKFIAQPRELSFMSGKMEGLSMLQIIFVYIFITCNNIFHLKKKVCKKKVSGKVEEVKNLKTFYGN